MAYTTAECLNIFLSFLPPGYKQVEDLLAGGAAQMSRALELLDELLDNSTLENSEDIFLDLLVYDLNLKRANGESSDSLVERAQNIEDVVIYSAIETRVNTILEPYSETCEVIEHFTDDARFIGRAYIGVSRLRKKKGFTVKVPLIGGSMTHNVYAIICNEVNRIKAAGMPWWLLIES